jgi:hypothetical protein
MSANCQFSQALVDQGPRYVDRSVKKRKKTPGLVKTRSGILRDDRRKQEKVKYL